MKKGIDVRGEFLKAADRLFCQKGFDQTSIQDILDATNGSKGGFYHYFPSKDSILQTLCKDRAAHAVDLAVAELDGISAPMDRINTLLHYANPLRKEEVPFMGMLLPLLDRGDGLAVRVVYQEALLQSFSSLLQQEIQQGTDQGVLFPCTQDLAVPILCLNNTCWMEACQLLSKALKKEARCDQGALQVILSRYRRSMEYLLDAPYASLELMRLDEWNELASAFGIPGF